MISGFSHAGELHLQLWWTSTTKISVVDQQETLLSLLTFELSELISSCFAPSTVQTKVAVSLWSLFRIDRVRLRLTVIWRKVIRLKWALTNTNEYLLIVGCVVKHSNAASFRPERLQRCPELVGVWQSKSPWLTHHKYSHSANVALERESTCTIRKYNQIIYPKLRTYQNKAALCLIAHYSN